MALILPAWFKQRQGKAEQAGDEHTYRLTAPQLGEAFIGIRQAENGRWLASLRMNQAAPETATTEAEYATSSEAWEAAFELYRRDVVT
ncbi:MAG: hypothetical protein ACJ8FY_25145 [Gemmataceae bacterium]